MLKKELVAAVAAKAGLSGKDAEKAVSAVLDAVSEALAAGEKVQLVGFGTFSTPKRPERQAKNPRTGEAIKIPAKTIAKFKPGSKLADAVD